MVLTFSGTSEKLSGILCLISTTCHQVKMAFAVEEVQGLIPRMTKRMENLLCKGDSRSVVFDLGKQSMKEVALHKNE